METGNTPFRFRDLWVIGGHCLSCVSSMLQMEARLELAMVGVGDEGVVSTGTSGPACAVKRREMSL
jgi:hypothetical protein